VLAKGDRQPIRLLENIRRALTYVRQDATKERGVKGWKWTSTAASASAPGVAPRADQYRPYWWRDGRGCVATRLVALISADGWNLLIEKHAVDGQWSVEMLGPAPPGEAGCIIPVDVISKLNPPPSECVQHAGSDVAAT
jgi:hypothetical protein